MEKELRTTGIEIIGDVPWGTHFCQFYETPDDLVDVLVPYFKAGLEANEFCMWVTSEPLSASEAEAALGRAVPDLDARLREGQIEIIPYTEWYLKGGSFDSSRVLAGWVAKLEDARARGFEGLRLTGNTFWLEKPDWKNFLAYEDEVNSVIGRYRMIAICTYSLGRCSATEVMDVVNTHQFALLKREGAWQIVENSQHKVAAVALREMRERYQQRELELRKLNQTLKALSDSNQAMMRASDEEQFLKEICRLIVEDCGHAMVWIGFAGEDEAKSVVTAASAGLDEGYLTGLRLTYADTERGRGPTGTAIRTGRVCVCRDMLTDPTFAPWRAEAIKRGYASSIALPLIVGDRTLGALTIYGREPDAFPPEEVRLLAELAGDVSYAIAAVRWRAARAKAEEALRESEKRYASLFNSMTEGFALHEIVCDEAGRPCDYRFLDINQAFENYTGLKREAVVGRTMREVLPDDDPAWIERYGNVALTGDPVRFENYSPVLRRHYEVFAYRPGPRQFAVVFSDITRRKRAEEELLEHRNRLEELVRERTAELEERNRQLVQEIAVRMKAEQEKRGLERHLVQVQKMEALGRFAGGIAHDMNNLLYPVLITAESLVDEVPETSPLRPRLIQIQSAASRQRDLVKRILAFSRRSEARLSPIRISPLIEETLLLMKASFPSTIEVQRGFEARADTILGDATQIQQVLINLCRNAADAIGQQPGTILVGLRNVSLAAGARPGIGAGHYLEVSVEDTGCGMGQEVLDRIFEPFFTTKESGRGTGMGLAVVHGIIKSHGGAVSVTSETGKGSRFSVLLPLTDEKTPSEGTDVRKAAAPEGMGTILLVDDEEIIIESLRSVLARLGFDVVAVEDGEKALEAFSARPDDFVLVITDLTMPKMTGLELADKISRTRPGLPIILSTGFGDVVSEDAAKSHGVKEVLVKPAGIGELKAAIDRALEKR